MTTGPLVVSSAAHAARATRCVTSCSSASLSPRTAAVQYTVQLEDQLLAELKYLPVRFVPYHAKAPVPTTTTTTTTVPASTIVPPTTTTTLAPKHKRAVKVDPAQLQRGHYVWRFAKLPPILRSLWRLGTYNVVLKGALMNFQAVHGLPWTGTMDGATWRALVSAARRHANDPSSYNYVLVDRRLPQTLKLYVNGGLYFTTAVNTGISVAPTASGTYPVYLRYVTTTMSGTLPDGKPYSDSGIPWTSYFNGGDALHGFIRASYGWPQSLGCVEMPFSHAAVVWPHTPIGTLVTVI